MNHNFADFELTRLLGNNPYHNKENDYYWSIPIGENNKTPLFLIGRNKSSITAWTWEDIRLYLKDKGYEIEIRRNNNQYMFKINCLENSEVKDVIEYCYYSSDYEVLRNKAIEECLQLIKQS